jgi:fructose-bisphosphate aldolase class II
VPLVSAGGLVRAAAAAGKGVAAFNAVTIEHAEAIVLGATDAATPVILALSHNAIRYHGALAPMAAACRELAAAAAVDIGLDLVGEAAGAGFGSVMFDASRLDDTANRRRTAEAVAIAHAAGVWLESELGEVGGKDGLHAPTARTDPAEADAFVGATGVDALAVAVGTSHAMTGRTAALDTVLVGRLRRRVAVPLVLHGSSGLTDAAIGDAVDAGIVKVNVGTQLNLAWRQAVRAGLAGDAGADPRPALRHARTAMADVVARIARVVAGAGPGAPVPTPKHAPPPQAPPEREDRDGHDRERERTAGT